MAAVFYHYLTQVPPPPNFTDFSANEHEELSQYLGLPTNPQDLFKVNIPVQKFHDFSITQILREIKFWDSRSAKSAIYAHVKALNFLFYDSFAPFED